MATKTKPQTALERMNETRSQIAARPVDDVISPAELLVLRFEHEQQKDRHRRRFTR